MSQPILPSSRVGGGDNPAPWSRRGMLHASSTGFGWLAFSALAKQAGNVAAAGIGGAALGSLLTLAITILIAFPLGVLSAVWLEEFAPQQYVAPAVEIAQV